MFQLRPGAYDHDTLIDFLTDLHQIETPRSVVLMCDGLPVHRGRRMLDGRRASATG